MSADDPLVSTYVHSLLSISASLMQGKADWTERLDPNSRRLYYINKVTRQTRWTAPATEEYIDEFLTKYKIEIPAEAAGRNDDWL